MLVLSEKVLIEKLRQSVIECDEEAAKKVAGEILKAGVDPVKAIKEGISSAAKIVGEKFETGEFFLPQLLLAGEAMESASNVLMSGISEKKREELESKRAGTVVLATVSGDIHDIGKNILALLLAVNGFKVYDLGKDVDSMKIVEKATEVKPDIIGLSALMTTTMPAQREVIDLLNAMGVRNEFIVMVGGGSTNREWAEEIEADGWAETAEEAVRLAQRLIEKKRRQ